MMDQKYLQSYLKLKKVLLSKSERFKEETFLPVLDTLISELTKCAEVYSEIRNLFSFFSKLKTIGSDELNKKCEHLANGYHKDLDYCDPLIECEHRKHNMVLGENCETLPTLFRNIILDNMKSVSPC